MLRIEEQEFWMSVVMSCERVRSLQGSKVGFVTLSKRAG